MPEQTWESLKTWLLEHDAVDPDTPEPSAVRRLDLSACEIESLPESIGMLEGLIALNLANNYLSSLPESFANLKNLANLDLRRNGFESLPALLGRMNIRSINAAGNRLTEVSILSQCSQLRVLDLSGNAIVSMNNVLYPENELRTVNLSCNYIGDMTNVYATLTCVERLNLSGNVLTAVPETVSSMNEVLEIDFSDNRIERIDEAFFTLPLESVDLTSNRLHTLRLHGLADLESMTLDSNPLDAITVEEDFAPYLKSFSCDGCGLKTFVQLPSESLESLCYSSNDIETIPETIGRYTQLIQLDIDGNRIRHLPHAMANMTRLQTLYIGGNPLDDEALDVIKVLHPNICDINMKSGIIIEKATETDLPEMAKLLSVLFALEKDFDIDYTKQLAGITKLFNHDTAEMLVARHENSVIGMVTMQRLISSAEGDDIGQIEDLVVREDYRKMGVGSRLINKIRFLAQEKGYKRIQLAADKDNANARNFYARRGFWQSNLIVYHYKSH